MTEELEIPATITDLEQAIAALPQVDMPVNHLFAPGVYVRRILIPAGTVLTSMRHMTEHFFLVVSGSIEVVSETEKFRYDAPHMGVTPIGTKRALHAITDTIWITIHANPDDETNPDAIGERILDPLDQGVLWRTENTPSAFYLSETMRKERIQ